MTEAVASTEAKPDGTGGPVAFTEETKTTQPDQTGTEGTEKQETQGSEQEQTETPEKRESRSRRRFNRERDRRIAAETELRLLKERAAQTAQPERQQQQGQQGEDKDAPRREQFDSYEEFLRADAKHVAQREAREATRAALTEVERQRGETQAQANERKQQEAWEKHLEAARDEIEDYDAVIEEGADAPLTPIMRMAILDSDDLGPRIAYHLAKHPEEAERIAKLKPSRQAAEIVALESKVKKTAKAPSKAPDPIKPVGGKAADATEPVDTRDPKAAEKLSTSEWIRRDRERMIKAGLNP